MEETQVLKCCSSFTIILIMISLGFFHGTNSETYTVGDEEEWDTGINYLTWSERYNFSMGDVLVFKYVAVQHNAYEVTEATYKSCNASTGVLAKYESGDDQVPLTEEKQYWFICTIAGHCLGGMRFTIDVKAASTNTTKGGSPPEMEPSPPPTNPDKDFASRPQGMGSYCLVAFGVIVILQIVS
ncbi:hypothetical protein AAG906_000297 [Vitis piasezkii]